MELIAMIQQYSVEMIIGLAGILLILLVYVCMLQNQISKLNKKYNTFMEGKDGKSLEDSYIEWLSRIQGIESENRKLKTYIQGIEKKQRKCIQKVEMKRYNSFEDMGGDLSYAVALVDEDNDGILLNGLHSRDGSYSYGKPVKDGKSTYTLTVEEQEVLNGAVKK